MKERVLLLFGGVSSEHDISLLSAASVLRHIPAEDYDVLPVGITKDGRWYLYDGGADQLPDDEWLKGTIRPAMLSPDRGDRTLLVFDGDTVIRTPIDVCFPVLHGKNGEDGTMQGLLEIAGIPYVGCGCLSSAMCMDKAVTNTMADAAGVPQAKWLSVKRRAYAADPDAYIDRCIRELALPIFVKPANAGSSVGITKARDREELAHAFDVAFAEDGKVVCEACVVGREIECAVLGNDAPVASALGEIRPCHEFYDFEAKYEDDSDLIIPAKLPADVTRAVQDAALTIYRAMDCRGLSRVDFFVTADGGVMFNEINTIPGFTSISMYPKLFAESGVAYGELIRRLLALAKEPR